MTIKRTLTAALAATILAAAPALAAEPARPADGEGWLARQFTIEEKAWIFSAEYLSPTLYNRPIDLYALEAARAWRFHSGFELQLRGGLVHTEGDRSDDPADGEGRDSSTTGITGGVGLRYYVIDYRQLHAFLDGSMQFYWAQGQPFPSGGSAINGLLRGGGGFAYDLGPNYAIEVLYHYAHVSNGGKPPQNPTWEGQGAMIGLRWRF